MDDEVILDDPFRIRLLESGAGGGRVYFRQCAGQLLDFRRPDPAARVLNLRTLRASQRNCARRGRVAQLARKRREQRGGHRGLEVAVGQAGQGVLVGDGLALLGQLQPPRRVAGRLSQDRRSPFSARHA